MVFRKAVLPLRREWQSCLVISQYCHALHLTTLEIPWHYCDNNWQSKTNDPSAREEEGALMLVCPSSFKVRQISLCVLSRVVCLLGKKEFFKTERVQKQLAQFFFLFSQSTTTFSWHRSCQWPPHTTPILITAESLLLYYTTPCIDAKCKKKNKNTKAHKQNGQKRKQKSIEVQRMISV